MVLHIILADILLIARIFPRPFGARKNTTQLAKYPHVLYVKPSNKIYILTALGENIFRIGLRCFATPPNTEYIFSQLAVNIKSYCRLKIEFSL